MEVLVAAIALCVAFWQLKLQRDEIRQNSRVNALIHLADLLARQIERNEKMIGDFKETGEKWGSLAYRTNRELRPMLDDVNRHLFAAISLHVKELDAQAMRQVLKLDADYPSTGKATTPSPQAVE